MQQGKTGRRGLIGGTITGAGLLIVSPLQAADFPSRPVTLIVSGPAGGTTDYTARLIAQPLSERLGVPVVVENRAGGNGMIALQAVIRARPDGHTLLIGYSGTVTGKPAVEGYGDFDPRRDLASVSLILQAPQVMMVHPTIPVHSLSEFISYAHARPGQLNYASSGAGSLQHLGTELLKQRTGIDLTHVPYRGTGETMNDVLAGRIQFYMTTPPPVAVPIRDGRLRALAMAAAERHPALPDVPTAAEAGLPGYTAESWFGLFAPKAAPRPIVKRLAGECRDILADERLRQRALQAGGLVSPEDPSTLDRRVETELAMWTKLVREVGIRPD
ncbi:tripartite tricarboxylate transporter substrate binding protein [Roseomonas sp. KE2513]|uniref:Bug family tripartite tricarboxylate transporter substrate binding protein n=1 Tax=Roseomonas sp. KE2513 TaxID=2479202 RepID=UPI0018DFD56B|nr:tripartite tricarboxylate transporter substrate binding protein [Roseomonas sp. KE2513]MBI0539111.1 tripartite tricarboxylate transporter substrate binding protein [Roseomonas sp. KE2513]